jgi:hypothetical protein
MRSTVPALILLLGGLVLMAAHPAAGHTASLLFDYVGFDYEDPDPDTTTFGEAGSGYVGVGFVPKLFAPLVADTMANEYTYLFSGLAPVASASFPPYVVLDYSPGTLTVYEDSKSTGTPADYGVYPSNAVAPSTFSDGTVFLTGTLTSFRFILNTSNATGSFEARYDITGGSQFVNIPPDRRTGWTFAGSTGNASNIPPGYEHQIDGQTFLNEPTPTAKGSWGSLKTRFRTSASALGSRNGGTP